MVAPDVIEMEREDEERRHKRRDRLRCELDERSFKLVEFCFLVS